ncbi:MAG: RNA methyltransferase [Candidatus Marinimicrobia bacterium]|nr:RNA methyltransferase [Candidatus Neomarinimicrobiota bacterium]
MKKLSKNTVKKIRALHNKKYRKLNEQFLISGLISVEEAIKSNYNITEIYYTTSIIEKSRINKIFNIAKEKNISLHNIHHNDVKKITTEISPQGIIAIAEQQTFSLRELERNILILDKIKDPGNLGTIFRIAHWFGLGGLILLEGTVEPENPKVIQSSMGSFFNIPFVIENSYEEIINYCKNTPRKILLSDVHQGENIKNFNSKNNFALVIGNESHGISEAWNNYDLQRVFLPQIGEAESLNAAVATASMLSLLLY